MKLPDRSASKDMTRAQRIQFLKDQPAMSEAERKLTLLAALEEMSRLGYVTMLLCKIPNYFKGTVKLEDEYFEVSFKRVDPPAEEKESVHIETD
jgi:hypothetical protein